MYTDTASEHSTSRSRDHFTASSRQRSHQPVWSAPPSDWYTAVTGHPPTHLAEDHVARGPGRTAASDTGRARCTRRATAQHHGDGAEPHDAAAPEPRSQSWERDDSSWRDRALVAEQRRAQLEQALGRRPAIEQAKGLLMGVFGLEADAAFDVLVWTSQHANTKLHSVAERFVRDARTYANGTAVATATAGTTIGERLTHVLHELAHPVGEAADGDAAIGRRAGVSQ